MRERAQENRVPETWQACAWFPPAETCQNLAALAGAIKQACPCSEIPACAGRPKPLDWRRKEAEHDVCLGCPWPDRFDWHFLLQPAGAVAAGVEPRLRRHRCAAEAEAGPCPQPRG